MNRKQIFLLALSILVVLSSILAAPLLLEPYTRPRQVVSSGYTSVTSGEVALRATLGQHFVGPMDSEGVSIRQGFWVGVDTAVQWLVNLPLLLKSAPPP